MELLLLTATGVVFALWAVLAFRVLLRLRARAVERSGAMFPGLGATLATAGDFARAPDFARDRRRLAGVTAGLFALILLRLALMA